MLFPYLDKNPEIHPTVFMAPGAQIIGEVRIGRDSSIWFQTVIRGDVNAIEIGERTNIQDLSMVHVTHREARSPAATKIGNAVTVGHRVILHGCHIEDHVLVGMGSTIMDHVHIEKNCVVGAGSLITENTRVPEGHLIFGRPAKVIRRLTPQEIAGINYLSEHYCRVTANYLKGLQK